MRIEGSRILILGGWGLVGSAITRKLMEHSPKELIVSSLKKEEAEDAISDLRKEFSEKPPDMFVAKWGNIFTRKVWKDIIPYDIIKDKISRRTVITDIFDELNDEILKNSFLYDLITEVKPDIVIDCINTATGIAYLDLYNSTNKVINDIDNDNLNEENVEKLMASSYIPQLIRHIQILHNGLIDNKCSMYLKIGTSGTGGMGMNIPYTHSEERPSRVLLSKTAVAGAQSLLMFLMARTPNGPIVKEIKPTATIAWKRIAYDVVKKGGKPIELFDMNFENAFDLNENFEFDNKNGVFKLNKQIKSVFIDTGENGIFSKGEFQAISSLGQMEIVTPEEIADYAVFEIAGGNSGKDVIQGLDAFTLGPTFRGGILQQNVVKKLNQLEEKHNSESIAFELLGPPRLSKLLHEANILRKIVGTMLDLKNHSAEDLSKKAIKLIKENVGLRSEILSIGLPILLAEGKYLKGDFVKIPVRRNNESIEINETNVNHWCYEGWIDLRVENFELWKNRISLIVSDALAIDDNETSSRFTFNKDYWDNFEKFDCGKLAGWIFEKEDKGWRFKR
ncbi:MAG: short-chain dehydrogenase [Candidatus Kapabacteria bacterium]|nr:short-chain dehydrogenase [Candidatus Kapabacteria bacterium]